MGNRILRHQHHPSVTPISEAPRRAPGTGANDLGMSAGKLGLGAAVALSMLPALALLIVCLTIYLRRE